MSAKLKPWSQTKFAVVGPSGCLVDSSMDSSDEGALYYAAIRESIFSDYKKRMRAMGYRVVAVTVSWNRRVTRRAKPKGERHE